MALIEAESPSGPLYHIGRLPDPLAWADWQYLGSGRFDDPNPSGGFRVLYAAEQRVAAFVETLQKWRPSVQALAALESIRQASGVLDAPGELAGVVPSDWHRKRAMGTLRLLPDQHWLDLREHETREALRPILAPTLHALGHDDFDLSDAVGRDRRLTQAIAAFAHEQNFDGIAYKSRFDTAFDCWAIYEGALFEPVNQSTIARDDPDFVVAMRRFRLRLADDEL